MSSIPRFWRSIRSRYNLIGKKCLTCGKVYFPPRTICPNCRRKGKLTDYKLKGEGKILTFTVIHVAPEDFKRQAPYIMAIVKLDEGPKITTQIVNCKLEEIHIGMRVRA
ncbi:MAG TPA: Zn-ribbon domain-containing OB-fold protein, partial [Candidatus Bathyarchaeota archaeon]|nr:Zn-ribbon domain-containing OB-fold protein [Candidatus Bathyarchaeota archaeon]